MFDELLASGLRHHAYGIEGDPALAEVLLEVLHAHGVAPAGSPDVHQFVVEQIGVEESKAIRARAHGKPFADDSLIIIIAARTITREAQNALLKTLEDPAAHTKFFLIIPSMDTILPTLRSRLEHVRAVSPEEARGNAPDVQEFITAQPAERLKMIAPVIDERDRAAAFALLSGLEEHLGAHVGTSESREGLSAVYTARRYLNDRGSSMKMLLEQVALLVPGENVRTH